MQAFIAGYCKISLIESVSERRNYFEQGTDGYYNRKANPSSADTIGNDTGGISRGTKCYPAGAIELGKGSFPKLKIPHQSHADFCSTDTAGGLDNKKRRYAPRGGVAYRLFLWGFPKGAAPHLAHDFAEQSVVCYTLCRRCRENAVAAGEGKGI